MLVPAFVQRSLLDDFISILGLESLPSAYTPLAIVMLSILLFYLVIYLLKVFLILVGVNRA